MKTVKLTLIGPCGKGPAFRVHAAGCRDIARDVKVHAQGDRPMSVKATNKREVAGFIYGPAGGSFYEEAGGDEANGSLDNYLDGCLADFHFAPCVKL